VPRYEQSVHIRRSVPDVFNYMGDISSEHEWQPHLVEAEQLPTGETRVGTQRRYVSEFMGKRLHNTYVVEELEENRRLVCRSTSDSAVSAVTVLTWAPERGGTRVTMSLDGKAGGALRFVPAPMMEAAFRREVDGALALLKERLEGAG
jgi:uncharacterized protein YndB with AHSA1/START domain